MSCSRKRRCMLRNRNDNCVNTPIFFFFFWDQDLLLAQVMATVSILILEGQQSYLA